VRGFFIAAVPLAAILAFAAPARAFSFCPVTIDAVQALGFGPTEAYVNATDTRFGVELQSEAPITASGTLSMATDGQIYRVPFRDLKFAADPLHAATAGYIAPPVFISFDRPQTLSYLWVSDVTLEGDTSVDCPLFPFRATHDFFNHTFTEQSANEPHRIADQRILDARSSALTLQPTVASHISRGCGIPDRQPLLTRRYEPKVDTRTLLGPTQVSAFVFISPEGAPLYVELSQTSDVPALNANVMESASHSTYSPATVDCMLAAGVYLFRALFSK